MDLSEFEMLTTLRVSYDDMKYLSVEAISKLMPPNLQILFLNYDRYHTLAVAADLRFDVRFPGWLFELAGFMRIRCSTLNEIKIFLPCL